MKVVGHQTISVNKAWVFVFCLLQHFQKEIVILLREKYGIFIVAPLDNMARHILDENSWASGHKKLLSFVFYYNRRKKGVNLTKINLTPFSLFGGK
jgi:hypothetical protein